MIKKINKVGDYLSSVLNTSYSLSIEIQKNNNPRSLRDVTEENKRRQYLMNLEVFKKEMQNFRKSSHNLIETIDCFSITRNDTEKFNALITLPVSHRKFRLQPHMKVYMLGYLIVVFQLKVNIINASLKDTSGIDKNKQLVQSEIYKSRVKSLLKEINVLMSEYYQLTYNLEINDFMKELLQDYISNSSFNSCQ